VPDGTDHAGAAYSDCDHNHGYLLFAVTYCCLQWRAIRWLRGSETPDNLERTPPVRHGNQGLTTGLLREALYGRVARYLHFGQNELEFANENKERIPLRQPAQPAKACGADGGT
jgi:hypothetical protein